MLHSKEDPQNRSWVNQETNQVTSHKLNPTSLQGRPRTKEDESEELRNLRVRKKSTVSIEETPDEEAVHITTDELPDQYEDMLALVPDTEDDKEEETIEGDLLITYLQEESVKPEPEEKEPLNQPIQVNNGKISIRAKTSISQSLAHKEETDKKRSFEDLIPKEYHEYQSVFEKTASEWFPEKRPWDHRIDLKPEFVAKKSKIYSLNQKEEEEMNKFIDDNLKKGFICKSTSPQASPLFFVAKKDSQALRPCQDYRYLNESMIKNTYPLPSIDDLLQKLHGAEIFMKLDIRWGYNNVWIKEGNEWKGAFITKRGLFELTVMFFGMTNSPATFQSMMNDYFTDMIAQGWVLIYIDDILIFSKDPKEHHERTVQVLKRLREKDLFLRGLNHAPLIPARFQSFLRNLAESRGIKIGPEPSQNDIPGDEYSSRMVSFLISSQNGPRNGQKGMHQEWNDWNTHYLLLLLINFSEQSYLLF